METQNFANPLGINPVLLSIPNMMGGHIEVRWYGLMYALAFTIGYFLLRYLNKKKFHPLDQLQTENFISYYLIIGMVAGARIIYCTVYDFEQWIQHPWTIVSIWNGGLSFHGAIAGMCMGCWLYAKKYKVPFLVLTDSIVLAGSQGLLWGRIGNFINGELYGRITNVSWAMEFAQGGPFPRHPSMLYEGLLEGILLPIILWLLLPSQKFYGRSTALFLFIYASFRIVIEFFREPDPQLGLLFSFLTMGQILCALMMIASVIFYKVSSKK
jgi:phosphatidylglycerol:prolipoprotein diacylglycerol transferase